MEGATGHKFDLVDLRAYYTLLAVRDQGESILRPSVILLKVKLTFVFPVDFE